MKQTKKQKAEYLFDEIGNVSDAFLGEALTYRTKKKGQVNLNRTISVAAALLVVALALPILWNSIRPNIGTGAPTQDGVQTPSTNDGNSVNGALDNTLNGGAEPPAKDENDVTDDLAAPGDDGAAGEPLTLEALLSVSRKDAYATVAPGEVDYFGEAYLLWQIEGDETLYRSRALTTAEVNRSIALIGQGTPVESAPTEGSLSRVYLVVGNGDVLTPYLPATDGNIGAAVLFDYSAELIPSESLISFLSDILN